MAVASAGPYASLHLAAEPCNQVTMQHLTTQFFTGRMPFLPPNQQHQSTEGIITAVNNNNNYCKILNSLKHLVRTTVAESHN